jgi:hypothetical protein
VKAKNEKDRLINIESHKNSETKMNLTTKTVENIVDGLHQ